MTSNRPTTQAFCSTSPWDTCQPPEPAKRFVLWGFIVINNNLSPPWLSGTRRFSHLLAQFTL